MGSSSENELLVAGVCSGTQQVCVILIVCPIRFIRFKDKWTNSVGSVVHSAWGHKERSIWLTERPPRRGGTWAIGCSFCALLVGRLAEEQHQTTHHA